MTRPIVVLSLYLLLGVWPTYHVAAQPTDEIVQAISKKGIDAVPEYFDLHFFIQETSKIAKPPFKISYVKSKLRKQIDLISCGKLFIQKNKVPTHVQKIKERIWLAEYAATANDKNIKLKLIIHKDHNGEAKIYNLAIDDADFNLMASTKTQLKDCKVKKGAKVCWEALLKEKTCSS